jgi:hypothetical protein
MAEDKGKIYLEYLDKEMSLMGILSTFCVVALALVLDRVLSADKGQLMEVWSNGYRYIILGSGLMLLSAAFFYSQRSLLAWYYGQISLSMTRQSTDIDNWLRDADSWATWLRYRIAFGCLFVAFVEYELSILCVISLRFRQSQYVYGLLPVLIVFVILTLWLLLMSRYKYEDSYLKSFYSDAKRRLNVKA